MSYAAPIAEMRFVLDELAALEEPELADAVLKEAARFAEEVLAPLNQPADRVGSVLENGVVRTPPGFRDAYAQYVAGGWNGLSAPPDQGGQGLPAAIAAPVAEMWNSANMSFALCPLLNWGALELLAAHGSQAQKAVYLKKLASGEWTGTMNLTEPQAGSDLGALRTRAIPAPDIGGSFYRVTGQKIFITYGDHDLADNIVHMVLARTPDAPSGSRGMSLFIVPKYFSDTAGIPGARNGINTLRLEEKLGIHASPTCVLSYEEAIGWRIGEENRGLELMFTMMNSARLHVGLQGVAIAERAYQTAREYARTRVQGRPAGALPEARGLPIVHHPDVRRMLVSMRCAVEAMRALAYYAAATIDRARRAHHTAAQKMIQARVDLLIPVVKAWCTDLAVCVASTGIQVHGGMGYIEETGAAQHLRDARILPIYEGTNGIQAHDLVDRKLARDGGAAARAVLEEVAETARIAVASASPDIARIGRALADAIIPLERGSAHLLRAEPAVAAAGAAPYLSLFGTVLGGWLLARLALAAERRISASSADDGFLLARRATALAYAEQYLALAPGYLAAVTGHGVLDFPLAHL